MNISKAGIDLIREFEGFEERAYQDIVGIWTIGYGTTHYPDGMHVQKGDICTEEEATQFLMHDINYTVQFVNFHVTVTISQNQFDAMCSLTYNIGVANFITSSVLKNTNTQNFEAAQSSFLLWDKITVIRDGKRVKVPSSGLLKRRIKEAVLFGPKTAEQLISK